MILYIRRWINRNYKEWYPFCMGICTGVYLGNGEAWWRDPTDLFIYIIISILVAAFWTCLSIWSIGAEEQ